MRQRRMPITHARIAFELEQDEDGYPPVSAETLWATPTPEGFWRIDNIPFFVYGIAPFDIIEDARRPAHLRARGPTRRPRNAARDALQVR
jgi:hypothetical protein